MQAHHASPDHIPHITPLSTYLKTFGTLMVLTIITVGVSYINLGTTVNLLIAVVIATIKASVVAAFFMHLAVDTRFNAVVFGSSIVFLMIFVGFTMLDTSNRTLYDVSNAKGHRANMADPFGVAPSASAAPAAGAPAAPAPAKH